MGFCPECGIEFDNTCKYCPICGNRPGTNDSINEGKNKENSIKTKKQKLKIILASFVFITTITASLASYYITDFYINGGSYGSKSPEEAMRNYFKAVSTGDVNLYLATVDYTGRYKNLDALCKIKNKNFLTLQNMIRQKLLYIDAKYCEDYGDNWKNEVEILYINKSSEGGQLISSKRAVIKFKFNGLKEYISMDAVTLENKRWFIDSRDGIFREIEKYLEK